MLTAEISERTFISTDGAAHLARAEKALELMRCLAVLEELQACRSNNKTLKAWFTGRLEVLRVELDIPVEAKRTARVCAAVGDNASHTGGTAARIPTADEVRS